MNSSLLPDPNSPRPIWQTLFAFRAYTKGYYDSHQDKPMPLRLQNLRDITLIVLGNPRTPVCDLEVILARFVEALVCDPASSSTLVQSVLEDARRLLGLPGVVA